MIEHLSDLLNQGQNAVAVFTYGPEFHQNPDNTGHTGNWLFGQERIDNGFFENIIVFVYLVTGDERNVYRAICNGVNGPFVDGQNRNRWQLSLQNIYLVGIAIDNWFTCAETHRQDFAYISR